MTEILAEFLAEKNRAVQEHAIDVAIGICQEVANSGGTAAECVKALQTVKSKIGPPPVPTNVRARNNPI